MKTPLEISVSAMRVADMIEPPKSLHEDCTVLVRGSVRFPKLGAWAQAFTKKKKFTKAEIADFKKELKYALFHTIQTMKESDFEISFVSAVEGTQPFTF